jgi:flagellar hook assembly protein FlgD
MGSLSSSFESSSIDDPEGIIISGSIYGFEGAYQPTSTLQPGKGYWINASADGQVTLNSGSTARIKPFVDRTEDANVIRFNGMPLYFGVTIPENEFQSYEIPPKPPTGAFDVRFADNMKVAENLGTIEIMNNSDQIVITYDIKDDTDWILAGNEEYRLSGSGEIVVNGDIDGFTLNKVQEVPLTYSVSQNYPNPFNPVTSINYEIPKESFVTISVYNLVGQKVTDLVSNLHPAGYHNIMWNSTDVSGKAVSSGVYIYTIQADDFRAVKKMVLMK